MPSRYNQYHKQNKISAAGARPQPKSGSHSSVTVKQGYLSPSLPGKASENFAGAKKGYKKVNRYTQSSGI